MTPDHTPYASYYSFGKYRTFARARMQQKRLLTRAFRARTAVFAIPSAFYNPWLRTIGAPLLALLCFRRRRDAV